MHHAFRHSRSSTGINDGHHFIKRQFPNPGTCINQDIKDIRQKMQQTAYIDYLSM